MAKFKCGNTVEVNDEEHPCHGRKGIIGAVSPDLIQLESNFSTVFQVTVYRVYFFKQSEEDTYNSQNALFCESELFPF